MDKIAIKDMLLEIENNVRKMMFDCEMPDSHDEKAFSDFFSDMHQMVNRKCDADHRK